MVCPKCGWDGRTRPDHYVDENGDKSELGSYCPTRWTPDKNGIIQGESNHNMAFY